MSSTECVAKFITSDNQTKEVSWGVYRQFGLFSPQDDPEVRPQEIPLPNVSSVVLDKVVEYCEHHSNDPLPTQPEWSDDPRRKERSEISEWDQKFLQIDQAMLFELIHAANYLDIKSLLDVGGKTVSNMIKGKTPEEIRSLFNIPNDFTPEEEAQIRRENEWAEDR